MSDLGKLKEWVKPDAYVIDDEDIVCNKCNDLYQAAAAEADERRKAHNRIAELENQLAKTEFKLQVLRNKISWVLNE